MPMDVESVRIVSPGPAELGSLVSLWSQLVAGHRIYGTTLLVEENTNTAREWLARLHVVDGIRIARVDGADVGFVTFELEVDRFERSARTGIVHNLFVRDAYREHGIGTALLERAESALAEQGAERVRLDVMEGNEQAAEFYEKRGYVPHRVRFVKPIGETDTPNVSDGES